MQSVLLVDDCVKYRYINKQVTNEAPAFVGTSQLHLKIKATEIRITLAL